MSDWVRICCAVLAATPIRELLATRPALVFSRIAYGGGETDWHYCRDASKLEALAARLRPGAVVSFYFDGRIRKAPRSRQVVAEIEEIIEKTGDAVVGVLEDDGIDIADALATGPLDLAEVLSELPPADIFYGATPGRDNDGVGAVTITLPDADGIVRPHPH